jgi:N-acetylmuramoyl-L-alanine amidase
MNNVTEADLMILARTIYGEARGELNKIVGGMQSLHAVAWVVKNRAVQKRFGQSITNVCLQPWQFSCWNHNDPNRNKLLNATFDDKVLQTCFFAATNVVFGNMADCTQGADHYHGAQVTPYWAKNAAPTTKIANHIFYKLG